MPRRADELGAHELASKSRTHQVTFALCRRDRIRHRVLRIAIPARLPQDLRERHPRVPVTVEKVRALDKRDRLPGEAFRLRGAAAAREDLRADSTPEHL